MIKCMKIVCSKNTYEPKRNPISLHGLFRYNVRVESTLQMMLRSRTSLIGRTRKIKLFFTNGKSEVFIVS